MFSIENRKKLVTAITVYCSILLLIVVIAQYDTFSGLIRSIFSALSPITIGLALAYLLNPILKFYEKHVIFRIKNKLLLRALGVTLTYLSFFGFIVGFAMLIIPRIVSSLADLINQIDVYEKNTIDLINKVLTFLSDHEITAKDFDAEALFKFIGDQFNTSESIAKTILQYITQNYTVILRVPLNIFIGFFISFYVLFTKEKLGAQFKKLFAALLNESKNGAFLSSIARSHATFGGYFTGVLLDAIFIGLASFLLLLIFKIPYASLIATVLAITNVIPIFGPFIGTIPCALFIFIAEPRKVLIFVILIIILQQIDGNIIAPKILGGSTGMSSLAVITSITIMGSLFGFLGMLIGVPVFAVIMAMISQLVNDRLRRKGEATRTAEYYPKDSIVIPSRKKEHHFTSTIVSETKEFIKKIFTKKN